MKSRQFHFASFPPHHSRHASLFSSPATSTLPQPPVRSLAVSPGCRNIMSPLFSYSLSASRNALFPRRLNAQPERIRLHNSKFPNSFNTAENAAFYKSSRFSVARSFCRQAFYKCIKTCTWGKIKLEKSKIFSTNMRGSSWLWPGETDNAS